MAKKRVNAMPTALAALAAAGQVKGQLSQIAQDRNVINANHLLKWRSKLSAMTDGNAMAKIALFSDSIGTGYYASNPLTAVAQQTLSFMGRIQAYYKAKYGDAGDGFKHILTHATPAHWTKTGTWVQDCFGVMGFGARTITLNEYAECSFVGTAVDVVLIKEPFGASVEIKVDGSVVSTVDTDLDNALPVEPYVVSVTGQSAGSHTLRVTNKTNGKWCSVLGCVETGGPKGVIIYNMSRSGATSAYLAGLDTEMINMTDYDIVVFSLLVNDHAASTDLATYSSRLSSWCDYALTGGKNVILLVTGTTTTSDADGILLYRDAMKNVAISKGVCFIDTINRWVGASDAVLGTLLHDTVHPNAIGHADIGKQILQVLES